MLSHKRANAGQGVVGKVEHIVLLCSAPAMVRRASSAACDDAPFTCAVSVLRGCFLSVYAVLSGAEVHFGLFSRKGTLRNESSASGPIFPLFDAKHALDISGGDIK